MKQFPGCFEVFTIPGQLYFSWRLLERGQRFSPLGCRVRQAETVSFVYFGIPQHLNAVGGPAQRSGNTLPGFIATHHWRLPVLVGEPAVHEAGSILKTGICLNCQCVMRTKYSAGPKGTGSGGSLIPSPTTHCPG